MLIICGRRFSRTGSYLHTKNYKVRQEYSAEGLRTKKSVNTSGKGYVDTIYVWDGDQLAFELDKDYNVIKRYVRGHGLLYADSGEGTKKRTLFRMSMATLDSYWTRVETSPKNMIMMLLVMK